MNILPSTLQSLCELTLAALALMVSVSVSFTAELESTTRAARDAKELLLFAKNPADWSIVNGGSGRMIYRESTGAFILNASGLHPRACYALIRYSDDPPSAEILARGTSDEHGALELAGFWKNWTRRFWLVSGEDVIGGVGKTGSLRDWRPDRYLFEEKQLGIAGK